METTVDKPRVLVVEDTPVMRRFLCQTLEAAGIPVVGEARNGEEALEEARRTRPDVVLLDVVMPVMNGIEVLPLLRGELPEAVILMLTSTSESHLVLQAREEGANGYILKQERQLHTAVPQHVLRHWERVRTGGDATEGA